MHVLYPCLYVIASHGFGQSQTILILTIDREKIMMFDQV